MKKFIYGLSFLMIPVAVFAATAKKQAAVQNGTTVRAKVAATGLYSQECYDAYYGCMDEFCISENVNGGSCLCSNDNEKYEAELAEINSMLAEADRIKTVEVEKIKLGANADIVFGGERKYDEKGNVVKYGTISKAEQNKANRESLLKMFEVDFDAEDNNKEDDDTIMSTKGVALFKMADQTCTAQVDSSCSKDLKLLRQTYQRQIDSDCRGFANSIAEQRAAAQMAMNDAESDVRAALKDSFDSANKYNQGECMVEFKKCMMSADACGADWANCVSIVASENMQKATATTYAGTTAQKYVSKGSAQSYGITTSVLDRMESKRNICERVLDQCMVVRDNVWDAFLREVAPTIKLAELNAESNLRQSCLTDITNCIHQACKDDIAGKGVATMDACLLNPEMARSFCKVQLEPCERMSPTIFDYVTTKLAAMRVDACTQEVKDCFMDDSRCGKDFMNCIGMDYAFMQQLCPVDKLVTCRAYHKDKSKEFSMDDVNNIVLGLYLNMDNKALENCQNVLNAKMMEVCGSTTDCNRFASNDDIGTGSLLSVKDKNVYRITGMISFGAVKINNSGDVGKIDIAEYMANASEGVDNVTNGKEILHSIKMELENVATKINEVIDMIASDTRLKYCVEGRSLDQITGEENETTAPRFPHLLDQIKMQIAIAALSQAQKNYQTKYNEYLTQATKDASADIAQYMCQMLPMTGGAPVGSEIKSEETSLAPPYAISYEVGTGLNDKLLARGGKSERSVSGTGQMSLGTKKKIDIPGGTREMWASFNRSTRVCHLCSLTITKDCKSVIKAGFLGIGAKTETDCTESDPVEKCDDIEM